MAIGLCQTLCSRRQADGCGSESGNARRLQHYVYLQMRLRRCRNVCVIERDFIGQPCSDTLFSINKLQGLYITYSSRYTLKECESLYKYYDVLIKTHNLSNFHFIGYYSYITVHILWRVINCGSYCSRVVSVCA